MSRFLVRAPKPWLAFFSSAIVLAGCGTPTQAPKPAAPAISAASASAPAAEPPAAMASAPVAQPPLQSAAVASRFPDPPGVSYRTPAFQDSRAGFTTNAELSSAVLDLARSNPTTAKLVNAGSSQGGVPLEALLFTKQPDASPAAMARSGKPTVLLIGQQHGDEPAGAEALLVLAQELARGRLVSLLDRINVLVMLRANPDGAQAGQQAAANGADIDRDHLLLRTPEAQALARLVRDYQPAVVVDAQEYALSSMYQQKFGGQRSDLLMQFATTPNMPPFLTRAAEEWFRRPLLNKLKQDRLINDWVHTTSDDPTDRRASMGSIQPENARNVNGLKNAVSLVIQTRGGGLGRTHLKRRVFAQLSVMVSVLYSSSDRAADLMKLRQFVEADVSSQACQGTAVVEAEPTRVEYALHVMDVANGSDKVIPVAWDTSLALRETRIRNRACGYWLAADQTEAVSRLRLLGARVDQITAKAVVQGESYAEGARTAAGRLDAKTVSALIDTPVGSFFVPMSQPLGNLVVAALEPDSASSYLANGLIKDATKVARLSTTSGLKTAAVP